MKKFKILLIVSLIVSCLLLWFDQSRSFYCLKDDKCITIWKRLGDKCYVIPGKYYGLFKPRNRSYIKSSNAQYMTLFFNKNDSLTMFVMDEGSHLSEGEKFIIFNCNRENDWNIIELTKHNESDIYKENALKKYQDLLPTVSCIRIDVKENYALDCNGKQL